MKKQFTALCLAFALLALLTGCGSKAPAGESSAEAAASESAGAETAAVESIQAPSVQPEEAAADAGEASAEAQAEGIALSEGAAFRWREFRGTVVKTDTGGIDNGMFVLQPAEMTEDEYCFNLYLDVDDTLKDNEELRKAFYEASILTDAQGNQFSPQVSAMPEEGADLLFLYAIPNGIAAEDLQLRFAE